MIEVSIIRCYNRHVSMIRVEGHANYDRHGNDIVCAAVSALIIATVNTLNSRCKVEIEQSEGFIQCEILNPYFVSDAFTEVFETGIMDIVDKYPENVTLHLLDE